MKDKVLWHGFSTVNFTLGCLLFKIRQEFLGFQVCRHSCKTSESVSHSSTIMGLERSWKDTTAVRFVHDGII